ncbi:MAG: outer membrane beta-barrel domain-containing protein [Bacteriovoracaceae bacterium]|nr:outer membrane beta-barrel domain-containing protein [Bacteriovoracaceae bacterium]
MKIKINVKKQKLLSVFSHLHKSRFKNERKKVDTCLKIITALLILSFISPLLMAEETNLYDFLWLDPDKKVYVLQNKLYKKKNSIYLDCGYTKVINQKFVDSHGFLFRGGYFFHEEWAFEVLLNKYSNKPNTTYKNVMHVNGSVPFVRMIDRTYGGLLVWSPFYGKINTFNKIYYFDWSFGLGVAQVVAKSNMASVSNPNLPDYYEKENYMGILGKTQLKFHITKKFHIGLEYMNTSYKAKSPINPATKSWRSGSDVAFMIGFSF